MNLVLINGSPKKNGNTADLLSHAIESLDKEKVNVEVIHPLSALKEVKVPFCTECTNPCSAVCYKGTALEEAYEILRKADGVLFGSPVYFGGPSGQLKAFWDMTRKIRQEKALINVVGGVTTTGAARFGGQETTAKGIYDMMLIQGMTIVGEGHQELDAGHHGAFAQAPAKDDANALKRVKALVKRIVEVAEATKSLRNK